MCRYGQRCWWKTFFCPYEHAPPGKEARARQDIFKAQGHSVEGGGGRMAQDFAVKQYFKTLQRACKYGIKCRWKDHFCPFWHPVTSITENENFIQNADQQNVQNFSQNADQQNVQQQSWTAVVDGRYKRTRGGCAAPAHSATTWGAPPQTHSQLQRHAEANFWSPIARPGKQFSTTPRGSRGGEEESLAAWDAQNFFFGALRREVLGMCICVNYVFFQPSQTS